MLRRHGIMKVSIETDIATGTFVMAPGHRGRTGQLSSVETGAMWIYQSLQPFTSTRLGWEQIAGLLCHKRTNESFFNFNIHALSIYQISREKHAHNFYQLQESSIFNNVSPFCQCLQQLGASTVQTVDMSCIFSILLLVPVSLSQHRHGSKMRSQGNKQWLPLHSLQPGSVLSCIYSHKQSRSCRTHNIYIHNVRMNFVDNSWIFSPSLDQININREPDSA